MSRLYVSSSCLYTFLFTNSFALSSKKALFLVVRKYLWWISKTSNEVTEKSKIKDDNKSKVV